MSSNTRNQILSIPALTHAWSELSANTKPLSRNTCGIDGVSVNDFAANHKHSLLRLSRKCARIGGFQFGELKPTLIKKPNGKDRLICVPTVEARIVQRALLIFLAEKYHSTLANIVSYGFIKQRSVTDAAVLACAHRKENPWVFKTDITSFFDTIDRGILRATVTKIVRERSLHPLLFEAINCEARPPGSRADRNRIAKLGIRVGKGVRQGMPLSPFFSNLLLAPFDAKVINAGIPAVRYADDLIFFASSREECLRIADFCDREFASLELAIPKVDFAGSKSVIYEPSTAAEFLGLELAPLLGGFELRLSEKQIERIRSEMLSHGSITELLSRRITLKTLGIVLAAKRNGYLAAYESCTNIGQVESALKAIERKCLVKIYHDELGIDLTAIGAEAHTFLGLGS